MKETLAFQILTLYRQFLSYTTKELKALGVSFGQMPAIIYIGKNPGCSQSDFTSNLKLDWGYSQRTVSKLADSGFITKEYDNDSGCNRLELTGNGERAFDAMHKVFRSWDQDKMKDFSKEEREELIEMLRRITEQKKVVKL